MIQKIKKKIRQRLWVNSHQLDLKLIEIQPKKIVGDVERFEEFKKVIANEYIILLRKWKMAEATAMDKLYGKLQELYESIYKPKKNIPTDPIINMQKQHQEMISKNSLDS